VSEANALRWGAIVVAAGRGTRFGEAKQFIELAGRPMVAWSIATFAGLASVAEIVVTAEADSLDAMAAVLARYAPRIATRAVLGGATRQHSVRNALAALSPGLDAAFVHDGARPLVRAAEVLAGMGAVAPGRGALLAAPVVDTIKVVERGSRRVARTLERETLWAAQTPQFALLADLRRAHAAAPHDGATDDAALLEAAGIEVIIVPASAENFKVTLPEDRARAEALLAARAAREALR
jgi:2-C-methyl-D-erythritol 4-phosphate cytidylyltransferase